MSDYEKVDEAVTKAALVSGAAVAYGAGTATTVATTVSTTAGAVATVGGASAAAAIGTAAVATAPFVLGGALLYGAFRLFSDD